MNVQEGSHERSQTFMDVHKRSWTGGRSLDRNSKGRMINI